MLPNPKRSLPLLFLFLFFTSATETSKDEEESELLLMTVASEKTDGFKRYIRSASIYELNGKVLGMGEKWKGGDMAHPGGAYKINLLKKELENYKDQSNLLVLFSDSYDVILLNNEKEILKRYKSFGSRVVFSAESWCWPDTKLESSYPEVERGYRFLNSGAFIGPAKDIYEIVSHKEVNDKDDDQLYYTKIFLDETLRKKWDIALDTKAQLFQNLHGAKDVDLDVKDGEYYVKNSAFDTEPILVHANGPEKIKLQLNNWGSYLAKAYTEEEGCLSCWENTVSFTDLPEVPQVVLAIFVERPTPFIEEFFDHIKALDYPREKIDLFVHYKDEFHDKDVTKFEKEIEHEDSKYNSVKILSWKDNIGDERYARTLGIERCVETKCDFYFTVDAEAHLDNPSTLKLLIEQHRPFIAPMLVRPYKAWSNFWGALSAEGWYARSHDYMELVGDKRRGLWNIPFVSTSYLIEGSIIHNPETRPTFSSLTLDPDMALCEHLRSKGIFMHISNRLNWGHLINADDFETTHLNNELWEISNNRYDWEKRYLHENYSKSLEGEAKDVAQPCPDVYWFPIVTERYADELVAEMENYGQWSSGSNSDTRLEGGYENVPTRDIHMNQIGYESHWLHFLDTYVRPLQEKVFIGYHHSDPRLDGGYEAVPTRDIHMRQIGMEEQWLEFLNVYVRPLQEKIFIGYFSDPPRALMNFVVRYKPDEQPFLRPHHDSSTYTINIALNHAGIDYEGGGCRFIRYDCSIPGTKKGWMLMHAGRLTHYHEGLTVTKGTRYIMVSFVDP